MKNYTNQELANMNRKQITAIAKGLPSILEWNESWTEEQKLIKRKLDCISMIDSTLIYNEPFLDKPRRYWDGYKTYADPYIKELGEENVYELYDNRKEYFKNHVKVNPETHTDSEGVTYKSITEY